MKTRSQLAVKVTAAKPAPTIMPQATVMVAATEPAAATANHKGRKLHFGCVQADSMAPDLRNP